MESLPPEINQLILRSITHPRDLGRLRQVSTGWRDCVNALTEAIDFDILTREQDETVTLPLKLEPETKTKGHPQLVPWTYLRGFDRIKFNGAIEVSDPAELMIIHRRHACSGLFLVVPPEKRPLWVPLSHIGDLRCCYYGGFLDRTLSSGQSIGYVRTRFTDDPDRMQQLDSKKPVYVYYHSVRVEGSGPLMMWTREGLSIGPFYRSYHVTLKQGRDEIIYRLQQLNPTTLIQDHRLAMQRVPGWWDGTTTLTLVNGWITSVNLSPVPPRGHESPRHYKINDYEIVDKSSSEALQEFTTRLTSLFSLMDNFRESLELHQPLNQLPSYEYISAAESRYAPIRRPHVSNAAIHQTPSQVIRSAESTASEQLVVPRPLSVARFKVATRSKKILHLHQPRWTKHDLKGHHPNTKNPKNAKTSKQSRFQHR